MKNKLGKSIVNKQYEIAAFLLPVLILVLAFAVSGIYPFGDQQIAIIDMYHQYVPFLSELQYKLHGGGSLFYTWNGAGGSNFWCLIAYYGASPLNLLLVLFPQKFISEGVTLILLIKIGLAGSFMFTYLKEICNPGYNNDDRCAGWQTVAFSSLYALSSYVLAYFWCIMWMDAIMLFPLCILGLDRLISGKGFKLYVVTLALIVFINYYMSIMVCIFILCYYPVLYFMRTRKPNLKHCARTTGKAVGASLLGIAMSAVMLLPTYLSMKNAYYMSSTMPEETSFYYDPLNIVNQLLPEAHLSYREGLPNIYCGLIVVILLVFYYMSRRIRIKEKVLNSVLLAFLFLSLNINKLDFIWHGFHFPNQLPHRFSFVICFLLIGMAYRAFAEINEFSCRQIGGVLAGGIGYYLLAHKLLEDSLDNANTFFYLGIGLLAVYCALLFVYRYGILRRREMTILLVCVISAELICSTGLSFDKTGNTTRSDYLNNISNVRNLAERIDDEFVRSEMDYDYTLNCPAMYHYKGVSQFSSSLNSNASKLMEAIGLEGAPAKNRYTYNQTNPVTNAMLGINYIIKREGKLDDPNFTYVTKSGTSRLYASNYPMSIGYMASDNLYMWQADSMNPFENLNDYALAVTNGKQRKVFNELDYWDFDATNISLEDEGDGLMSTIQDDSSAAGVVKLTYRAEEAGNQYVFVEASGAENITIERMNVDDNISVQNDSGSILNIGTLDEDEMFSISIEYKAGESGTIRAHVCTIDEDAWESVYAKMSSEPLEIDSFTSTKVSGHVNVTENELLVFSIPYEEGWTLKVDGKKRNINSLVGDIWISTELSPGSHEIELSFRPPGIIIGLIISLVSLMALLAISPLTARLQTRYRQEEYDYSKTESIGEESDLELLLSQSDRDHEPPQSVESEP